MTVKDTKLGAADLMPWNALAPLCVLFDMNKQGGNFCNPWFSEGGGSRVISRKTILGESQIFVSVLKTPSLRHFSLGYHYKWNDTGFKSSNFISLIQQEYALEYRAMVRDRVAEEEIYKSLGARVLEELVGVFPLMTPSIHYIPKPRTHVVYLQCKKQLPVNGVTPAVPELYHPEATVRITPGLSDMLRAK